MSQDTAGNTFYFKMGLLLLALVIAGFGGAAMVRGGSPLELPLLFHMHGLVFIAWFLLFINQARLIGKRSYDSHKTMGLLSLILVAGMLTTGVMIAAESYSRGTSPVPNVSIQQFMAFPLDAALSVGSSFSRKAWEVLSTARL